MTDCAYFQTLIRELNPADTNTGDCCSWSMVECEGQNIVKLDFSKYEGISKRMAFPQTLAFFNNIKEFSIKGQQNIYDIYTLPNQNLEKVDLSNSGMASESFPTWIMDAPKLKELDISNTQITGLPQREFKSKPSDCNFSNTPICGTYQSSPYDFMPDNCKSSCAGGYVPNKSSNTGGKKKTGGTPIWPFIVIGGVAVLVIALAAVYFIMKRRKNNKETFISYDDNSSPRPILPFTRKEERENESVEINVAQNVPKLNPPPAAQVQVPSVPPQAVVVNHDPENKKIEEVARNNYTTAYGGDAQKNVFNRSSGASVKDIYRQHNASTVSMEQDQSFMPHPSIYNTMTTDNDSEEDEEISDIINEPIINALHLKDKEKGEEQQPDLLRRKSSRKAQKEQAQPVKQEQYELYIANWDYTPTLSDELALVAGDVIEIKRKFDDGWSNGYNRRTKQTGIVPLCYLKEYEEQ